ncbi:nucleotidyltransferase domain-containing protein [candidate division WOR-3 bacterium]|nr:nucleotidyltransferase domain-containing protein [candidate division WOR-3 bacterium]
MNKTLFEKILKEIVAKIARHLDPDRIILFGSYAYGEPGKDSDLDLFIVMESNERPSKRRIMVNQLFWEREMAMDFIVKTPSEVKERLAIGDPFVKKIIKKGKVLYERKVIQ